jgi:hypothetical protein
MHLDEQMRDGIQHSREGQTEAMTSFQQDALHISQKAQDFEKKFDAGVNAERRAVSDKASAMGAGRQQAKELAEGAAGAWHKGVEDQAEKLSVVTRQAHAAQEKEDGASDLLAREEDTNGRRLSEGAHTMAESVVEGGDKTARDIASVEEEVATDAKTARVASATELQGVESAERAAAQELDNQTQALSSVVGGTMGNVSALNEYGVKSYNLTERQVQELEAFVGSERGSQGENRQYLQKYVRQAAVGALVMLADLVAQEMKTAHGAFAKNALLKQQVKGAAGVLGDLTSSEAFQALHTIATSDELALTAGQDHEDLLNWLDIFEGRQGAFEARVNSALEDQGQMANFTRLLAEESVTEQQRRQQTLARELQGRVQTVLTTAAGGGTDTSALDSSMEASVHTLQELGQSRAASDRVEMQRLQGELDATDSKAARKIRERADVLAGLTDEKQEASQKLSTVDSLIASLQKANDKKMDEETELLNKRAKSFSQELLLGETLNASPDVGELRREAASLSKQNAQLEQRHTTTEKTLRDVLAHISKASAAVAPAAYRQ